MADEFDFFENSENSNNSTIDTRLILIKLIRFWPILIIGLLVGLLTVFIFHRYTIERISQLH